MGRTFPSEHIIPKAPRPHGPQSDPRFTPHHRQPRADKLDARQRRLCLANDAFKEALRMRVASAQRFSAFMDGAAFYIALEQPCPKCADFRRRTRDRSCYRCHLTRGGENFERMKAGLAPKKMRSKDGHRDQLERQRAEREGEFLERRFGDLVARRWPLGRLEITFPDGWHEADLANLKERELINAISEFAALKEAMEWAGWTLPYMPEELRL